MFKHLVVVDLHSASLRAVLANLQFIMKATLMTIVLIELTMMFMLIMTVMVMTFLMTVMVMIFMLITMVIKFTHQLAFFGVAQSHLLSFVLLLLLKKKNLLSFNHTKPYNFLSTRSLQDNPHFVFFSPEMTA